MKANHQNPERGKRHVSRLQADSARRWRTCNLWPLRIQPAAEPCVSAWPRVSTEDQPMNSPDISQGISTACQQHGRELLVRPATDGTETQIAFCRHCRRYYGRVMNSPQLQGQGFRHTQPKPRKAKART
jgi:hypothetical protein